MTDERQGFPSASSIEADSLCVGRHRAVLSVEKSAPSEKGAIYASIGNQVHELLDLWFSGKEVDEAQYSPDVLKIYHKARDIAEDAIQRWAGDNKTAISTEKRLWSSQTGRYRFSGRLDLIVSFQNQGNHHLILDFKALYGDVAISPKNLQLRSQAALLQLNWECASVTVGIVQPMVSGSVEFCYYDEKSMEMAVAEVGQIVKASIDGGPRTAGEKQCTFCIFKNQCHEYAEWRSLIAPSLSSLPVHEWKVEQKQAFLERQKSVRDFIKSTQGELKEELAANPDAIPGWRLTDFGKRSTTITDIAECYSLLSDVLSKKQFYSACSVSVTGLVSQIMEVTGCGEDAARKLINQRCESVITFDEGERFIVKVKQ